MICRKNGRRYSSEKAKTFVWLLVGNLFVNWFPNYSNNAPFPEESMDTLLTGPYQKYIQCQIESENTIQTFEILSPWRFTVLFFFKRTIGLLQQ